MPDLADGESTTMQGSGSKPYTLKNVGGAYSCTCPAWCNQSLPIERRTCKHLRKLRGDAAEEARLGAALAAPPRTPAEPKEGPPVLLAERWDTVTDLAGWWMSEKLDGLRAYWDGQRLWSRLGNPFHAPDWFLDGLPAAPLDGELWVGRKQFARASSLARRQDKGEHWKEIRYVVFDAPAHGGEFEARMEFLRAELRRRRPAFAEVHGHEQCRDLDHLRAELARVEALGGEGLMLRQPASRYVAGRSATLLKVKTFHDAEARVVGHEAGKGRHKGRLGALLVELADGTRFAVGTGFSDAQRESPAPVGALITFRYQELSEAGVPRFPSYVGVRAEPTTPAPAPATKPEAKAARRFEYGDGPAARSWEVAREGRTVTLRFGPAGGRLNTKAQDYATEAAARAAVEEMVAEKRDDGFVEVTAAPEGKAPADGAGLRRFEFVAGSSNKFWEVWVRGNALTTRYGRIGGVGQTTTKEFADEAEARQAADKLVAAKTGKGYVEKT